MKARVTSIEFDFESDGELLPEHMQRDVIGSVLGQTYELSDYTGTDKENAAELVDRITDETGWCITSLNYLYVLA